MPELNEEATQGTQVVVVALRTRSFLPSEVEKAGERTLQRGVEAKGKDMIVKLSINKVREDTKSEEAVRLNE